MPTLVPQALLSCWILTSLVHARHSAYNFVAANGLTWQRFLRANIWNICVIVLAILAPHVAHFKAGYNALGHLAYDNSELVRIVTIVSITALIRRALVHIERRSIASLQLGSPSPRVVTRIAQAILHGWCAAGSTLAAKALFKGPTKPLLKPADNTSMAI